MSNILNTKNPIAWSATHSMCEVELAEPDDFLKVKETLTRIGIPSDDGGALYQSCHILHKRGKYYIVHFKEMFLLDNKSTNYTEFDLGRRNSIIRLLEDWNLLKVLDKDKIASPQVPMSQVKVISFKEKDDYTLVQKYTFG
tara:strand:- start:2833 stop:3255 length:423 start_codon:yes stop_codon:yes gene_type:complete